MFNRNAIKISYSCTSNFRSKMLAHNSKILNKNNINEKSNTKDKVCDCCKELYPLNNQCLVSKIIYRAKVSFNKAIKQYLGSTGNSFKQKYRNHKSLFNYINKKHTTELSNYIWNLKIATHTIKLNGNTKQDKI